MIANCLKVNEEGHLEISGCDTVRLAEQYGTPLYVMSEDEIRETCRRYVASFAKNYNGNGKPIYASKAFSCKEIYRIVLSEGLDVEVVSGGELYTALQAGVPGSQIHFQGNNKSVGELTMAIENGEWIMRGLDWNNPYRIRSWQELIHWINEVGFLPLFKNEIGGFSTEEHTSDR